MNAGKGHPAQALLPIELAPRVNAARSLAIKELLAARGTSDHWSGELSSSALSTATAATALAIAQRAAGPTFQAEIKAATQWLAMCNNPDGGWGDTVISSSNLSTTVLCWAAFTATREIAGVDPDTIARAEGWIAERTGGLDADRLARAIIARYGKDRTFSVPILTMCALAGSLGSGREAWRHVIPLPFELAACPPSWFAALRLPVVSYALPALIAIGQARHHHRPSRNPLARTLRGLARQRTLRILKTIQPASGGFLEATPLTSFVTMSLAGSGETSHPVVSKGIEFLRASQRSDGSWPIDSNLATWVTTLAINALNDELLTDERAVAAVRSWLLRQQYLVKHPYTQAAPGGWAWTDLPGGVPDADDTSGALLALHRLGSKDEATHQAATSGLRWLLTLQNRDGGVPTFCRGWGTLPFDRSSADLTAHALRAWLIWFDQCPPQLRRALLQAVRRAVTFLQATQNDNGSWVPLWFGNQDVADETNPAYGTARVLRALVELRPRTEFEQAPVHAMGEAAIRWLVEAQNADGGWGGAAGIISSVEETALTLEALAAASRVGFQVGVESLRRGLEWLTERVESGRWRRASPIGFYFARLWYYERLYPLIFTVAALGQVRRLIGPQLQP